MKKINLSLFVLTMATILIGIFIFQSDAVNDAIGAKLSEIIHVGIIVLLFLFGIYFAFIKIKSEKQGVPSDDELSKKIRQKAAATSYMVSLYLWLIVLYLYHNTDIEANILIGGGIAGMALFFGAFYLFYNTKGNINE